MFQIKPHIMTGIALDIAEGLYYLNHKNIIHCDIAARNILLTVSYKAKIADFGLAVDNGDESNLFVTNIERLAIRWLPPEAQFFAFNKKTDIWSFGVVVYEIITLGKLPYPSLQNNEVMSQQRKGVCPSPNMTNYPIDVYNLLSGCWSLYSENRFTINAVINILEKNNTLIKVIMDEIEITKDILPTIVDTNYRSPEFKWNSKKPTKLNEKIELTTINRSKIKSIKSKDSDSYDGVKRVPAIFMDTDYCKNSEIETFRFINTKYSFNKFFHDSTSAKEEETTGTKRKHMTNENEVYIDNEFENENYTTMDIKKYAPKD